MFVENEITSELESKIFETVFNGNFKFENRNLHQLKQRLLIKFLNQKFYSKINK